MGRPAGWMQKLTGRGAMRSSGTPSLRNEIEPLFWKKIAVGITSENAAHATGVSSAVGTRWFRHRGGIQLFISRLYTKFLKTSITRLILFKIFSPFALHTYRVGIAMRNAMNAVTEPSSPSTEANLGCIDFCRRPTTGRWSPRLLNIRSVCTCRRRASGS